MSAVPVAAHSVGRDAAPLLDQVSAAKRALVWLGRHGFRPIQLACGPRVACIAIETSALCATLDGAPCIRRWVAGHAETVMVARVEGCEVRWVERGH